MRFTSGFESWLLSDGCYPPLERGQLVNLAFSLTPKSVRAAEVGAKAFEPRNDGSCRIVGNLVWILPPRRELSLNTATGHLSETDSTPIFVVDSGEFRCYVEDDYRHLSGWPMEATLDIEGDIFVDYYVWSEIVVRDYPDAPDIFFPLRVERIRHLAVPEHFIVRSENAVSSPASVELLEVDQHDVTEVRSMRSTDLPFVNDRLETYRPSFFLLDLSDQDLPEGSVPRTFR